MDGCELLWGAVNDDQSTGEQGWHIDGGACVPVLFFADVSRSLQLGLFTLLSLMGATCSSQSRAAQYYPTSRKANTQALQTYLQPHACFVASDHPKSQSRTSGRISESDDHSDIAHLCSKLIRLLGNFEVPEGHLVVTVESLSTR
jgi:hypothetical protein